MADDDLSPDQLEVRRLLAEARHDQPLPEDVAARLHRVLADLASEPVRMATVTDLATRRRRAGSLLAAAAAVIAVGIGVSQVIDLGTSTEESLTSADRETAGGDAAEAAPESPTDDQAAPENGSTLTGPELDAAPVLRREAYAQDVTALRRTAVTSTKAEASAWGAAGASCGAGAWGEGEFVAVRYDGVPAVLVFRKAVGDTQVADLFLCGDEQPRRSVTLPAP